MILRRYVTRSLIGPFFIGFGFVTFLLTIDMLLDLLELLIVKGVAVWTVFQLFVLALGWMVALSIPCGVLVSVLMTYGRLSQDNEIIAMRASGVNLITVIRPALAASVIVAVGLGLFNNYVLPDMNYGYSKLLSEVSRKHPTAQIRAGMLISDFQGYNLWIGRLDDATGAMQDVLILDGTQPQEPRTILAERGTLRYRPESNALTLDLEDGEIHEADPASPTGEYRRLKFRTQTMNIIDAADQFRSSIEHQRSEREMSVEAMDTAVRLLRAERTRQDSLARKEVAVLPVKDSRELGRIYPSLRKQPGLLLGMLHKGTPAPASAVPPGWTAEQKLAAQRARSHYEEMESLQRRINSYRVEIQKKFSIPVACVVFVLVGAPLGVMARRGGMAAGFFSAVFFIFYYLCLVGGEQLADRLILSPWLSMWMPNLILGALGLWLTVRAVQSGQPARRRKAV